MNAGPGGNAWSAWSTATQNLVAGRSPREAPAAREVAKELVAAPIEAWRVWKVVSPPSVELDRARLKQMAAVFEAGENPFVGLLEPRLTGVGHPVRWETATLTAHCQCDKNAFNKATSQLRYADRVMFEGMHEAPQPECDCGVWAVKTEEQMLGVLARYSRQKAVAQTFAYGRVQMWGRVFEHNLGYRSQYARPVELTVITRDDDLVADLAAFYGCPVTRGDMPKLPPPDEDSYFAQLKALQAQMNAIGASQSARHIALHQQWAAQLTTAPPNAAMPDPPTPTKKSRSDLGVDFLLIASAGGLLASATIALVHLIQAIA